MRRTTTRATKLDGFQTFCEIVNSITGSDGKLSSVKSTGSEGSCCPTLGDFKGFKVTWNKEIYHNRETWKAQAAKDLQEAGGQPEEKQSKTPTTERVESESRMQQEEEGDDGPGGPAGSVHTATKKHEGLNGSQPDCPLVRYCKRPNYAACSYRMIRSKVTEMRPIDARGKARRLQRISLRRQNLTPDGRANRDGYDVNVGHVTPRSNRDIGHAPCPLTQMSGDGGLSLSENGVPTQRVNACGAELRRGPVVRWSGGFEVGSSRLLMKNIPEPTTEAWTHGTEDRR
ncbi:hypothetical protein EYF80_055588 [Liparis tanakae]|uniref:Uncharacterized protein n=1 Tax=Liparis tanakae TaxID=230148 RepID=A0A4Z2F041_9TELE|nr:hypothetical protein EYF80_055588 [Liparis tanakae]